MTGAIPRRSVLRAGLQLCGFAAVAAPVPVGVACDGGGCAADAAADLARRARGLLAGLHARTLRDFLELWPAGAVVRPGAAATLPVLRYLPAARDRAARFSSAFAAALVAAAPALAWRRTYTEAQVGAQFLDNYGWTELVGLNGPLHSERLACGVLLLGPRVTYPLHHHEADEIYVPLSGVALWRHAGSGWESRAPGSVIHHVSGESHAMQTGAQPLLALYLWRSDNLAQKSQLDAEPADG